jgi:hypothetical protein
MSANDAIKKYLAEIGAKGGAAGKGKAKTRPPEFYKAIAAKAAEKRSAAKAARLAAEQAEGKTKRPRGRPKKEQPEEVEEAPKRPRGRPRKSAE